MCLTDDRSDLRGEQRNDAKTRFWTSLSKKKDSIDGTLRSGETLPSCDLSIECAASDKRDRVAAVTCPGRTKLVFWVKSGDRYAVKAFLNHAFYREVTATRGQGLPQPCIREVPLCGHDPPTEGGPASQPGSITYPPTGEPARVCDWPECVVTLRLQSTKARCKMLIPLFGSDQGSAGIPEFRARRA